MLFECALQSVFDLNWWYKFQLNKNVGCLLFYYYLLFVCNIVVLPLLLTLHLILALLICIIGGECGWWRAIEPQVCGLYQVFLYNSRFGFGGWLAIERLSIAFQTNEAEIKCENRFLSAYVRHPHPPSNGKDILQRRPTLALLLVRSLFENCWSMVL